MTSIYLKEYREMIGRLKKARLDAGLKQSEVADAMGKPQSYISKIENYQRRIDVLELKRLAKLYKVKIGDLI